MTADPLWRTSPSDVVFLLSGAGSCQHAGPFTEVAHKIVTEVEGQGILIGVQPPEQHTRTSRRHTSTHIDDCDPFNVPEEDL